MADIVRIESTLDEILAAFVAKLHKYLQGAGPSNCYINSDADELPSPSPGGQFVWIISPTPQGTFDGSAWAGGGIYQATCATFITVTAHSLAQNDEAGHAKEFFLSRQRGIFAAAMLPVIAALCFDGGDLTNSAGEGLLAEPLSPQDYDWNRQGRKAGSVQISFNVKFDWKISALNLAQ